MPNPTLTELEARVRTPLNEAAARFWSSSAVISWLAEGLQETHARMKVKLRGRAPAKSSSYWKYFLAHANITLVAATQEYALPVDFDIFLHLIDPATNEKLAPYDHELEKTYARSHRLGVQQGQGYYDFVPGFKIRVLVWPGREGVPIEARDLDLHYLVAMPYYTTGASTCILPAEFTGAAIHYATAKGLLRERESPTEEFAAFEKAVEGYL